MDVKVIIFDLEYALIDYVWMKREAYENSLKIASSDSRLSNPQEIIKNYLEILFESDNNEDQTQFPDLNTCSTGQSILWDICIKSYAEQRYSKLEPYENVKETLEKLVDMGIKLSVVSEYSVLQSWKDLNITNLKDQIITVEKTNNKNEKKIERSFIKVCDELEVEPTQTMTVGGFSEDYLEVFKKLGMKTCFVCPFQDIHYNNYETDYKIQDLNLLLKILDEKKK